MNKIIKKQLDSTTIDLPFYDDNTTELVIKKSVGTDKTFIIDHCYLIKLEDYIINPPINFTLHTNWNNGIIPKHKYMKVECRKLMGKMINVVGFGFDIDNNVDINDSWEGWLPLKSIELIKEI